MNQLYPLKFIPQFKEKIWGGRKLEKHLNKSLPDSLKIGESWEISTVPGTISEIVNGELKGRKLDEVIQDFGTALLGNAVLKKYGNTFPLLIKFLDAQDDLSIQVHPNDELALRRHQSLGKSEMWYILQADEESKLIKGFSKALNVKDFITLVDSNNLESVLQQKRVRAGDVYNIPAGTIHNIGKGILLAEIQQTSDITYRISDFDRKDSHGNSRDLHISDSVEALNFEKEEVFSDHPGIIWNESMTIVSTDKFLTKKYNLNQAFSISYPVSNSFRIIICTNGKAMLKGSFESMELKPGDTILIPACIDEVSLETEASFEMLETQIP